ncbi:MAG TPA: hypothetical protein ENI51_09175 [Candidatus Atribacteria bacterium]|nr:hypothetical protein [Candidatus Atribacteria bacterium]
MKESNYMEQQEINLWRMVDVGGYAAMGTLFAFALESIKTNIENDNNDNTNIQEQMDKINNSYEKISKRFQKMNLNLLDKRFPVDTLRKLKEQVFPEMGKKYKELETLLRHYISGAFHLKIRILNKIKECKELVKQMSDLGIEFSKNDRYWKYRNTNPERIYLK